MDNHEDVLMPHDDNRTSGNRAWKGFVAGVVMTVLAGPVIAAPSDATQNQNVNTATQAQEQPLTLIKGSKLIGKGIVDAQNNKKLGKVKDMAIDLSNNRIDYIVVSSGGMLGIGDKLYAVPAQVFGPYQEDRDLVLNGSSAVLMSSQLPDKNWLGAVDRNSLNAIYQRAGAMAPLDNGASPQMVEASDLIGMGILTQQGEKAAADVKDLAVALQDGRAPFVLVSVGGPSGMNTKYVALPTAALKKGPVRDRLYVSSSAQELNSGPEIDKDNWLQALSDPSTASKIYASYRIPPYWTQQANTAEGGSSSGTMSQPSQGLGGTTGGSSSQTLEHRGSGE